MVIKQTAQTSKMAAESISLIFLLLSLFWYSALFSYGRTSNPI